MKKSIFLFFAAILCAMSVQGAVVTPQGKYFYFKPSSDWKKDGARFAVCFQWKDGGAQDDAWVSCTAVPGATDIYYVKAPDKYWDIFFCRMNGSNQTNDWSNKWNQTDKLQYDGSKNYWTKSSTDWNGAATYSTYAPPMSSVTLADNGTTVNSGTGTQADPYIIEIGTKIKVQASGTKAVDDPDAVINYAFKYGATSQDSETTTWEIDANSPSTTYAIELEGYTKVNTTSSEKKAATKLYYQTVADATLPTYQVTVTANDPAMGTVTGTDEYSEGATAELTATPNDGYKFVNWTVGSTEKSTNATYSFTVTENVTLTANFQEIPKVTVYAINSVKWDAIAVHHWHENGAGTEWPGDLMINIGEKAPNGFDVYTATFLAEHENCIFNNNGNGSQTATLAVHNGQYYDLKSNTWYASLAEVPAPDPLATDVFLAGSMNGWSTTANEFKKVEEGSATATLTMNLEAETVYEFKVVREGAWTSSKDSRDIKGSVSELVFSSTIGDNTMMTTTVAGDYVFTWNDSKLSITYPASTEPDPTPDPDPMTLYLLPNSNWIQANARFAVKYGENWADMVLVSGETNVYQVEIDKSQVSKISFHRMNPATTENNDDNCWNNSDPLTIPDGKNCCSINDGEWSCGTNVSWLNYPYKYYIAGTENLTGYHWDEDGLEITDDNSDGVYSKTFTALAADTYEFKITAGIWGLNWGYTNLPKGIEYNGVEQGKDEYGNANGNIKIILEETQDITINFNPANEEISIVGLEGTEVDVFEYYIVGDFNGWNTADVNFGMVKEGDVYKKEVTFAVGNEFKVCDGTWDNSWGMSNLGGKAYKEFEEGTGNIKMKEAKTFTIIFNPSENLITFDGLTETDPVVEDFSNQPSILYFRPSTNWKDADARFAAYFFGTEAKWLDMTDSDSDGIYEVANDKTNANVIFCRMNPATTENNWDNKWTQTDDIVIPNEADNLNTVWVPWQNYNYNQQASGIWVAPTPLTDTNWSDFVTAYKGKTINAVVERSFVYEQLHTLCLPFNVELHWLGEEAKAYKLNSVVGNSAQELSLNASECATMTAGQPYIVKPKKGSEYEYLIVADAAVQNVSAGSYTITGGGYKVTMQGIAATPNPAQQTDGSTEYWLAMEDGCLYKTPTNKLGLRSIIKMTTTSGAPINVRARVAFNENVETGVEDIIATDAPVKVIVNGQLIIIRDGIKYNVQGQVIR